MDVLAWNVCNESKANYSKKKKAAGSTHELQRKRCWRHCIVQKCNFGKTWVCCGHFFVLHHSVSLILFGLYHLYADLRTTIRLNTVRMYVFAGMRKFFSNVRFLWIFQVQRRWRKIQNEVEEQVLPNVANLKMRVACNTADLRIRYNNHTNGGKDFYCRNFREENELWSSNKTKLTDDESHNTRQMPKCETHFSWTWKRKDGRTAFFHASNSPSYLQMEIFYTWFSIHWMEKNFKASLEFELPLYSSRRAC